VFVKTIGKEASDIQVAIPDLRQENIVKNSIAFVIFVSKLGALPLGYFGFFSEFSLDTEMKR
jgi:hypothetical protein